ncbi:MAG: hypothetical protein A3D92_17115 [Bacteroidetes bacterium RIFCSPHIGHO2_02_FULL_44_7]|nr:MAG: hypothetical protein A3D92_17115 [Bacteroidetes bacterium RIFCSPHIGHO2_02_FULL_44_7]
MIVCFLKLKSPPFGGDFFVLIYTYRTIPNTNSTLEALLPIATHFLLVHEKSIRQNAPFG